MRVSVETLYANDLRSLAAGALASNDAVVNELFAMRRARIEEDGFRAHARSLGHASPFLARHQRLLSHRLAKWRLSATDFQRRGDVTTSLLRSPDFLRWSLASGAAATRLIADLVTDDEAHALVVQIFERSVFQPQHQLYSTIDRDELPCIQGRDGITYRELGPMAHELGHCLHDAAFGWSQGINMIESEACAQYLEEVIVAAALLADPHAHDDDALSAWHDHQRRIDQLNVLFCQIDHEEIFGRGSSSSSSVACPFPPSCYLFRPSFFAAPGFEAIYLLASILRLAFIDTLGEIRATTVNDAIRSIRDGSCLRISRHLFEHGKLPS